MLLTSFLFQKWLGSPFSWRHLSVVTLDALTPASVHSFVKLSQVFEISFALQYSQACIHPCCLCTFSYPIYSFQSTLHLICFDTAIYEEPHLSAMTLCDLSSLWRVSDDCLLDYCQVSRSSPLLWFQRTRYTQNLYCMDGRLLIPANVPSAPQISLLKRPMSAAWRAWQQMQHLVPLFREQGICE